MLKNLKKFTLPEIEEEVLRFWKENHVFERALTQGKKTFVFYEGPPTANGKPGLHHVLTRAFKDVVLRYKTMRGYRVPRQAGWDTHGLPVELQVEKELGLKSKKEIEKYGVAEFNRKCKESVWRYKGEWERLTERIGFWLDMRDPYITYDNGYIEKLWGLLKEAWKKKLLYKGYKVLPWCTRCGTALSSHEVAQGYREDTDNSVYVKFKLKAGQRIGGIQELRIKNQELRDDSGESRIKNLESRDSADGFITDENTYILSWTTTPWTLPGNVALAVGEQITYAICRIKNQELRINKGTDEFCILAENLVSHVCGETGFEIIGRLGGKELTELEYEPLFEIGRADRTNRTSQSNWSKAYKIYAADFVNTDEGTGVVHTAVMYGEDDYNLGVKEGLPQHHTVDEEGKFTKDVPAELAGLYVKSAEAEEKIFAHLRSSGYWLAAKPYAHDYPHCWRCDTALLYYGRESWFIAMSKLRKELVKNNESVNWIPAHIRDGRMGEWLREAKDWAISRDRYWGTPLPIWECGGCGATEVLSLRAEIAERAGRSLNRYILVRHGEAENNVRNLVCSDISRDDCPLTLKGRAGSERLAENLKKRGVKTDLIYASDFGRTRETAAILAKNFKGIKVHFDSRLREMNFGEFHGGSVDKIRSFYVSSGERFVKPAPGGETLRDVARRVGRFILEMDKAHKGKTIIIVSHESPLWMLESVMRGWSEEEAVRAHGARKESYYFLNDEAREVELLSVPRSENMLGDLHRPYIDELVFSCRKCADGKMKRVSSVADVWFDSGAMPWASQSLITKRQSLISRKKDRSYPADYICEAVDQTRGWFYTLLAVATFLGKKAPYKNAISLGHILDKEGKKMSKSKGNVVDPWEMINKYGADVVRWYMYTVNPPGDPIRFQEEDLAKVARQFFGLVYNSYVFFETYGAESRIKNHELRDAKNVLDKWILARLNETIEVTQKKMDAYDIAGAARFIQAFAEDISRWHIRRSRARFQQSKETEDYQVASETLEHVLLGLNMLLAPFTPFFAEAMYNSIQRPEVKNQSKSPKLKERDSVHLVEWPAMDKKSVDGKLVLQMAEVRRLAALALALRAEKGIKVRQPLRELRIKNQELRGRDGLLEVLKDEVNVKEIVFDDTIQGEVKLDTEITHELMEEGLLREFMRAVQGLRQDAGFLPKDVIALDLEGKELESVIRRHEPLVRERLRTKTVSYGRTGKFDAELETKMEGCNVWIGVRKLNAR